MIGAVAALNVRPKYRLAAERALYAVFVQSRAVPTRPAIAAGTGKEQPALEVVHLDKKEIRPFTERE